MQVVHTSEALTQVLQKVQNWALQWPREHASRNWLAIGSFLSIIPIKLMILYMHVRSLCHWLGDLPHHLCALVVLVHVFGSDFGLEILGSHQAAVFCAPACSTVNMLKLCPASKENVFHSLSSDFDTCQVSVHMRYC